MSVNWYIIPTVEYGDVTILRCKLLEFKNVRGPANAESPFGHFQFLHWSLKHNVVVAALANKLIPQTARKDLMTRLDGFAPLPEQKPEQLCMF